MTKAQTVKDVVMKLGKASNVHIDSLDPNPWNPNVQSDFMASRLDDSIAEFGFLDPILVRSGREKGAMFKLKQIIDGFHRWTSAKKQGYTEVIIIDVGRMSDARAKVLTDLLNNLRGAPDPLKWKEMVLSIQTDAPDLLALLPYKEDELLARLKTSDVDWDALNGNNDTDHRNQERDGDGKLFKKFSVSLPEATMRQAQDILRRVKAAHKIDSDAEAFKLVLDGFERSLATTRPVSVAPPAPTPQTASKRRRVRAA